MSTRSDRIRFRTAVALIGALLPLWLATPTWSQDVTAPAEEPLLISLEADSTSVNDILGILAARTGLNIVTSPEVQGRAVSIRLRNTPFDEALNLVVRAAGLGYERVGNSILVADPGLLKTPTGLTTRVFELEYASPDKVAEALKVVTGNVAIEPSSNRVIIRDTQSLIESAASIIEELDQKPGQVLLQARLLEVGTSDLTELGVDWEKITKFSSALAEGPQAASPRGELPDAIPFTRIGDAGAYYRQASAFEIAIDALVTNGKAKILSNSRVVTIDNEPAEIFVGETIPVVVTSLGSGTGGGTFQTIQLEKIDVGVKLYITPRISDDGFITTTVEPEVSTITAFVGPDDDLPQTATRRARSIVRVADGEKIYLGGLISETERSTVKRVPVLGHIPILGALFQRHREDRVQTDLVIEVTPKIIGDREFDSSILSDDLGGASGGR